MAHMIDTMAYAKELPWHGLGTYVGDEEVNSDTMLVKAGLDWEVRRDPVYVADLHDKNKMVVVPNAKSIRRMDRGTSLAIMSDGYRPIQNKGKFKFFDELVGGKQAIYHTAMSLDEGRKIAILAKLPGDIRINGTDDVTHKYVLLADSFDGSIAFTAMLTPIRVVCANTLNAALAGGRKNAFRLRHSVNVHDYVAEAQRLLGFAVKEYDKFGEAANFLAQTKYSETQMKALAEHLFPTDPKSNEPTTRTVNARATLLDLFENGKGQNMVRGTAWAGFNAVTEFTDHERTTRTRDGRDENEARSLSVLFGASALMKQQAVNYIYQQIAA